MGRPSLAFAISAIVGGLCACGEPAPPGPAPTWVDLARGFRPRPLEEVAQRLEARVEPPRAGRIVRGGKDDGELWFELPLPRALWTSDETRELWRTPIPTGGALLAGERTSAVLVDGERVIKKGIGVKARQDRFALHDANLLLTVAEGAEPSDTLRYRVRLDHGREVDGAWRAAQRDLAVDGFLVFPGEPERLTVAIPPASRLCFASISPDPDGRGPELGPTTFRVKLDGRTICERAQPYRRPLGAEWNQVELESGTHELTFEVDGPAPALFGEPVLAPRAVGSTGARPWPDARPDLVLVLCDTFRADNLAAWGGAPELAPHLNRFVESTLRFLDARSAAAWTLPSIATILSGVFPAQHGATDVDRGVADAVDTVAEVLGRAGYRTVAVTDAGLFSRHYGQDQGFQWFEETAVADWSLNDTLARARAHLAADDGRPLFLLVHTYRVHGPMRSGPDEDQKPYRKVRQQVRARIEEIRASGQKVDRDAVVLEFADEGRRFYEDAVQDLDRKVGAWLEELQQNGFFEHGSLVLTADHGNAHGEHGQVGHGSDLYDVKLRIPLALAGAGITPRAVSGATSLIDLAPTLAALAGVAPAPSWMGRSLLGERTSGPIYAFDFKKNDQQVALYADGRKLMAVDVAALRAGKPIHAFDLATDPREDHDLVQSLPWPAELARALAERLEPMLVPAADAKILELPTEVTDQLQAIGYMGEEKEEEAE